MDYRQGAILSILSRALRKPTATFAYQSHATSHGVVRTTARADLLDLIFLPGTGCSSATLARVPSDRLLLAPERSDRIVVESKSTASAMTEIVTWMLDDRYSSA